MWLQKYKELRIYTAERKLEFVGFFSTRVGFECYAKNAKLPQNTT